MADSKKKGLSRRDFLAGAFGVAGLAATAGALGGCTAAEKTANAAAPSQDIESGSDIEVIETEMLIIGTGNGALAAAWHAMKEGRQITLVDKGPYRHSGPSGWSWGCYSVMNNPAEVEDLSGAHVHMPAWKNTLDYFQSIYNPKQVDNCVYQINKGQTLVQREEDGQITPNPRTGIYCEQYFRREMDAISAKPAITIYDNTMITDVFINDGVCLGAMGLHLPSGKFRVFRAKATVMGVGAPVWYYGWHNTKPVSLGGADNTGELQAACYRHGLYMGENEWGFYDFSSLYPRVAFLCQVGVDAVRASTVEDAAGNPVFTNPDDAANRFQITMAKAIHDGRGGPNNGLFVNIGDTHDGEFYWEQKNKFQKQYFGFDFKTESIEVVAEQFEKGGTAVIDENMMTEIEGLFDLRGAGAFGCRRAYNSTYLKLYGAYTGHSAGLYAAKAEYPKNIDWQPALDEYTRLHELRTREVANGIRPHVIRENVQKTNYTCDGLIREKDKLEAAIAEYERIRAEDLPKMALVDRTVNWNREWKDAIETLNLLDAAEMTARSTLFREESRLQYSRPDFPEKDDVNWKCMVVCRKVGDTMEVSKRDVPTL
jgi:succinate dehydrogenase / fumarate reductase flavoprotein subunit